MTIKNIALGRSFWFSGLVFGCIVMVIAASIVFFLARSATETRLQGTANYMKVQCSTYTHYNEASEALGLLRSIENTRQVSRNLVTDSQNGVALSQDLLKDYTERLWLNGIIIMDTQGREVCSYYKDVKIYHIMSDLVQKKPVLLSSKLFERSYSKRDSLADGAYMDMSACPRLDAPGIVVTYYYTSEEYVRNYVLTLQSLLSGYSVENDGTIVIVKDGMVSASNDTSLVGQNAVDNVNIKELMANGNSRDLLNITSSGNYGLMLKQRDYYIYVYVSSHNMLKGYLPILLAVLMVYLIVLVVIWAMVYRKEFSLKQHAMKEELRYKKQLEQEAKRADEANQSKTKFLQRMSHDIRTPINGIIGMLEVAEHYGDDLEKQAECRDKIGDASRLLLELVNEILDMGKLESGEIVMEHRPFSLKDVDREVVTVIEKLAVEQGINLINKGIEAEHTDFIGSPGHVKRLLMNIMSNAVKYNKVNGSITISCTELPSDNPDEAVIQFICTDTGIGMSEEYQKNIFEPFTQENQEVQSKYGGSGLGMPIMKALVEQMNGTVDFTSEQGKGTTFVVTIPFEIDKSAKDHEDEVDELVDSDFSLDGIHVLLAEDNELNMEIAEFVLTNQNAVVTKVWNGLEAVEAFRNSKPGEYDIILMDVMMPEMNGYEASRTIRSMERPDAATIPIVAMTANAFTEDRIASMEAGMNEHLLKPLDVNLVITTIAKLLKKRK